jgi:cytochrome c oxidase subunit 2
LGCTLAFLLLLGGAALAQDGKYGNQEGGWWLPPGASTYTHDIDFLYKVIFVVVAIMFLLTEGLLILFCIIYRRRPGHRPAYIHGNKTAEIVWTIVPALMLIAIAIWQIPTWNAIKKPDWKAIAQEPGTTNIDVLAETFTWNYRYRRDVYKYKADLDLTTGRLTVPFGGKVLLDMRSRDVIHSYFVPHLRVKQDTVPGIRQKIWWEANRIPLIDPRTGLQAGWSSDPKDFEAGGKHWNDWIAVDTVVASIGYQMADGKYEPIKLPSGQFKKVNALRNGKIEKKDWAECTYAIGFFEVACAELCGLGHYKMKSAIHCIPRAAWTEWFKEETDDVQPPNTGVWKFWVD